MNLFVWENGEWRWIMHGPPAFIRAMAAAYAADKLDTAIAGW